jgi:hypothetical protein
LSAGYFAPGKKAYIAVGSWFGVRNGGAIQLDPPAILLPNGGGPGYFLNDSRFMWYLYRNKHHKYEWVDSQNAENVPFAVDLSLDDQGFSVYFGRIKSKNNTVAIGTVAPFMGAFFHPAVDGKSRTTSGYQVLTCKSCRKEKKIPMPKVPVDPPTPAQLNACGRLKLWLTHGEIY